MTYRARHREKGSALVITLLLLALVTMELAVISIVLTRGLGDEGILVSQNIVARRGAEVGVNRLADRLTLFVQRYGPQQVEARFSRGGTQSIRDTLLKVTNPKTQEREDVGVTVRAWVKERRGEYYHLVGEGSVGRIQLATHRWVRIESP